MSEGGSRLRKPTRLMLGRLSFGFESRSCFDDALLFLLHVAERDWHQQKSGGQGRLRERKARKVTIGISFQKHCDINQRGFGIVNLQWELLLVFAEVRSYAIRDDWRSREIF